MFGATEKPGFVIGWVLLVARFTTCKPTLVLSKAVFSEKAATEKGISVTDEREVTGIVPAELSVVRSISVRNGSAELQTTNKLLPGTKSIPTGRCPTEIEACSWFCSVE